MSFWDLGYEACRKEKDSEIERLKRDLIDMRDNIQAHSMIVDNAEKDAEIERLKKLNLMTDDEVVLELKASIEQYKEENESHYKITVDICKENNYLKKLITELADALEIHSSTYPGAPIEKLIRKAREVEDPIR